MSRKRSYLPKVREIPEYVEELVDPSPTLLDKTPYYDGYVTLRCLKSSNHPDYQAELRNHSRPYNDPRSVSICPMCSGRIPEPGKTLQDLYPDLSLQMKDKGLSPATTNPYHRMVSSWSCDNPDHPKWNERIRDRTQHNTPNPPTECPYCSLLPAPTQRLVKLPLINQLRSQQDPPLPPITNKDIAEQQKEYPQS